MKKIRYFFEYLLVKFWLNLVLVLPLKCTIKLSTRLFSFIGIKLKATKTAYKNLKMIFPNLSDMEIYKIIAEVWSNLAHIASETPHLLKLPQEEFNKHVKIKGLKNLKHLKGKKALFFSAHLANWELIGKILIAHDFKFHGIYRPANNKLVDKIINDTRLVNAKALIPKGKAGAKQIIQALQDNQHVYMLVDQKMNDGIKVPFLGHDAMTAPAIASLAIKYDCPIIPIQIIRRENSCFEMVIYPSVEHKDKTVKTIMAEINDLIGTWVKQNPGQWFWLHNRWISK